MTLPFAPVAAVRRGDKDESWHLGVAAVATPDGRLVASLGDPAVATFVRSAVKPVQALPLLLAGGVDRYGLVAADLALMCASHSGAPAHVERAERLLALGGFGMGDLRCGAHPPLDPAVAAATPDPTPLHNNCSGKHAGFLLACRARGWETTGYLDPDHPLQRDVVEWLARLAAVPEESIGRGVDGCSAPTFQLPVEAAARVWAALAAPDLAGLDEPARQAAETLVAAMATAPEMVAGRGRFTTRLAEVTGGRVLGKEGAEGFYAVAVRGPVALGLALKIADGGERARDAVVVALLRQMGSLSAAEVGELASFQRPERRNHRGLLVGEIVAEPVLVRC